jgi:hypothetical protein
LSKLCCPQRGDAYKESRKVAGDQVERDATDEAGSTPLPTEGSAGQKAPRSFLSSAMRDLSEEELAAPAGRRFLIAEIERLDKECDTYRGVNDRYHDLRVDYAKLQEATRTSRWLEILSFTSSSIGSVGIGAAANYLSLPAMRSTGVIILVGSCILVITGLIAKVFK